MLNWQTSFCVLVVLYYVFSVNLRVNRSRGEYCGVIDDDCAFSGFVCERAAAQGDVSSCLIYV